MTPEQETTVADLQESIGNALIALRRCTDAGVAPGDAVRAAGIPWPSFADVSLEMMVAEVPAAVVNSDNAGASAT